MEISVLNEVIDLTYKIITSLAIILGGIWTFYKFGLYREKYPSMEIINGIKFLGENSEEYLLELNCRIVNKGNVRKWLVPLEFEFLFLKTNEKFIPNKEYLNGEIEFHSFYRNHIYWVNPAWHIPFVDGKCEKVFSYLTAIPKDYDKLTLFTHFVDFNNKGKAVYYLQNRDKFERKYDNWDELTTNEQIDINSKLNKKSDFYYAQFTTSIQSLKLSINV